MLVGYQYLLKELGELSSQKNLSLDEIARKMKMTPSSMKILLELMEKKGDLKSCGFKKAGKEEGSRNGKTLQTVSKKKNRLRPYRQKESEAISLSMSPQCMGCQACYCGNSCINRKPVKLPRISGKI